MATRAMTKSPGRLLRIPALAFDALIVAAIFVSGLVYYGGVYIRDESKFAFYQKYFYSAVNIYCLKDPDVREYNGPEQDANERIDPAKVDCRAVEKSPRAVGSYFNGWHDTHPVLSTLIGYTWRWLGFSWAALWPIAGALGSLTVVSFYLILRGFGLPWHVALLLFPASVPFAFLERNFYYLRDFSKVPFILLAFAVLGVLFRKSTTPGLRFAALSLSTAVVVLGMGFRQDALVLLPTIAAAAMLTASVGTGRSALRLAGDLATIAASFLVFSLLMQSLKTTQAEQLQGYPHFLVQGFADPFWSEARTEVPGISFLAAYSDMLAWAAVDANSSSKVNYFSSLDPKYTTSGFDLIAKYASLSAADAIVRVFTGLSATSHGHWILDKVGTWFVLLLVLIAVGRWRLSYFLAFAMLSLAAAGSLQFSLRHSLHFIALDRVLGIIVYASLIGAAWRHLVTPARFKWRFALLSGLWATGFLSIAIAAAYALQNSATSRLKSQLEALRWLPSAEAYAHDFPTAREAVLRVAFDGSRCPAGTPEAIMVVDGEKIVRAIPRLGDVPRPIYFTILDPTISKLSIEISPAACVAQRSWAFLGDGSLPPLQFFDPEAALTRHSLGRLFGQLGNAFR